MSTAFEKILGRKRAALDKFIEDTGRNGVRQNTPEWVEIKKQYIGGSEIASALGKNPFQTIGAFIQKKLGISTTFTETMAMRWGKLFEPVGRRFVEHKFNTQIKGDDLFLYKEGDKCAYSPDGLGIALFKRRIDVNNDTYSPEILELIDDEIKPDLDGYSRKSEDDGTVIKRMMTIQVPTIILLELKFPMVRTLSSKVPDYYLPQPKAGLALIDCAEHGIFVELVARPCSLQNIGFGPEYARGLEVPDNQTATCYSSDFKKVLIGAKDPKNITTAATGLIIFMGPESSEYFQKLQNLSLDMAEILFDTDILDLSDCSAQIFGLYLEEWRKSGMGMICEGNLSTANGKPAGLYAWYSETFLAPELLESDKMGVPPNPDKLWTEAEKMAAAQGFKIIAYLPWKIIDHRVHEVEKEHDFIKKNSGQITEVTNFIARVQARIHSIETEKADIANGRLSDAELKRRAVQSFINKEESVEVMIDRFSADYSRKYGQARGYGH